MPGCPAFPGHSWAASSQPAAHRPLRHPPDQRLRRPFGQPCNAALQCHKTLGLVTGSSPSPDLGRPFRHHSILRLGPHEEAPCQRLTSDFSPCNPETVSPRANPLAGFPWQGARANHHGVETSLGQHFGSDLDFISTHQKQQGHPSGGQPCSPSPPTHGHSLSFIERADTRERNQMRF